MIYEKCTKCFKKMIETGSSYNKRIKDIFNPLPFVCHECLRIIRIFNPNEKDLKNKRKYLKIIEHKNDLRKEVRTFNKNKIIQEQKEKKRIDNSIYTRPYTAQSRAKRKKASIELDQNEKKIIRELYRKCPPGYDVDHIIPISKGGKHCVGNLQYLPSSENRRKSSKILIDILEQYSDHGKLSVSFLQRKFKMNAEDAINILKEIGVLEHNTNYQT